MATIYSPFSEWLTPLVRIGQEKLAEIIQLELHRYVLSKTDKNGLVYDSDGNFDLYETNAAFHLLYSCERLTDRIAQKSFTPLKHIIKGRLEADGKSGDRKVQPTFSLCEFYALTFLSRLFELVTQRNFFKEIGYNPEKLVKQFLSLYQKPDRLFAEAGGGGESSLFSTAQAVWILKTNRLDLSSFDPKLESAIKAVLSGTRRKSGGYTDNLNDKVGTIPSTFAGCYLTNLLAPGDPSLMHSPAFTEATIEFINRLKLKDGGYRADGLTPMPNLKITLMAVLTLGMLNDYKYRSLPVPKKEIINYLNLLERRDGGAASVEWKSNSNIESTILGLMLRLLLGDKFVM